MDHPKEPVSPQGVDNDGSESSLRSQSLRLSQVLAFVCVILSFIGIAGWVFGIPILTRGHPALPAIQPNTILGLNLAAIALLFFSEKKCVAQQSLIVVILASLVSLLGLLTLCEYVFGWDLGIDQVFINKSLSQGELMPGRPAAQTAVNFILLGTALLFFKWRKLSILTGQSLALIIAANSLISAMSYIFSTKSFYGFPVYTAASGMALSTSAAFLLLAGSLLLSRPDEGLMRLVTSDTRSGGIARRILWSVLFFPTIIGFLTRIGVILGWYDLIEQIVLFVLIFMGLIIRTTWRAAQLAESEELRTHEAQQHALLAQQQTFEAQERFELALRGADLATWDWNLLTGAFTFNARWAEMRGFDPKEIIAHVDSLMSSIHPEDLVRVQKQLENFLEGRITICHIEFRVITKSKNWIWVLHRCSVFERDDLGKPTRIVGTELDITQQKQIESEQRFLAEVGAILASTLDYNKTLDNIVSLAVRDIADICIMYSVEKNGEVRRTKAVSRDPSKAWICDILINIPFDISRNSPLRTLIETKSPVVVEELSPALLESIAHSEKHLNALRAADMKSYILVPLVVHGKLLGAMNLVTSSSSSRTLSSNDLYLATELAQRAAIAIENARLHVEAQRAKLIADNIPAMMAYWDKEERCQFANHAYIDWFGLDSEKIVGQKMIDLLGADLYEKKRPYILGAFAGQTQDFVRDLAVRRTGEIRHTKTIYIPEVIKNNVLGFFVLIFDVTDLQKAQVAALSQKEKALSAVKTREDVLSIVSHDLKNPLASVNLSAQYLRKMSPLDIHQVHECADRIERSVGQMENLIGDLLDFGKIQSGTFVIEQFRENAKNVIFSVVDGMRPLALSKRLSLEVDVAPGLHSVACDAHRINQVLSNLLGNAIKFTPEGGSVRLLATNHGKDVMISISDTGPGIPPEQLPKVFDRFWQARETKHLGSGLGLAIAKGIIEAHGTKIWAESQISKGSCFSFTLPGATEQTPVKEPSAEKSFLPQGQPLAHIHILIVDDAPDILLLIKKILENAGAKVSQASSAQEGLAKFTAEKPHLILSDIEMPTGDGYSFIKMIRQASPKDKIAIPIIAFTGNTETRETKKISDAGFDAHLSKTVQVETLIRTIQQLLTRHT